MQLLVKSNKLKSVLAYLAKNAAIQWQVKRNENTHMPQSALICYLLSISVDKFIEEQRMYVQEKSLHMQSHPYRHSEKK